MLGGTTSMNGCYYSRGNKKNYDTWAANGCDGWSYDEVLPYFKKSENNMYEPFLQNGSAQYHGNSGPMKVSYLGDITPSTQLFVDAAREKNISFNPDPNGASEYGIAKLQFMAFDGRRQSTATAFINPKQGQPNLKIWTDATVTKILINDTTSAAYGVKVNFNNQTYTAYASKEVILSAGVIEVSKIEIFSTFTCILSWLFYISFLSQSPKLLMLSGVGPKAQLEALNITNKKDLPVGENLQDHVTVLLFAKATGVVNTTIYDGLDYIYQWAIHNSGPYPNPLALASFISTDPADKYPNHENIYFTFAKGTTDLAALIQVLSLNPASFAEVFEANEDYDILGTFIYLLQPKSRGTIKLNGTNPYTPPIIDPNYFESDVDLTNCAKAAKEQNSYSNTEAFKKYNATPVQLSLPECGNYTYGELNYWKCYCIEMSSAGMH